MTTATTTAETGATSGARAPANINKTPAGPGQPTPHGIANNIADTGAAKGGHGIVAEDAEFLYEDEPQEPDYKQVAQVLASVKDEHLDLYAEMSMAISLAKKYGGIGTVCQALDVSEAAAKTVGFVGLSRISISGVHYEPSEDGPLAVVIPVTDGPWDEEPAVYDMLAFLKDIPNRCWSRLGNARCLGRWHLQDAVSKSVWPIRGDSQKPVMAFRTPLEWLQGGCEGFCCLNEDWLAYEVTGVSSIQPADGDVEFGRHLKRLIYEPSHLPKILIPRAAA